MAPLPPGLKKPSARSFRQQRVTGQVHPLAPSKTFRSDAATATSDGFLSSKRDKRLIKHSTFMSRVVARSSGAVTKKTKRTGHGRSKKLNTTLDGLADALPALEGGDGNAEALLLQHGKVRHRSLKCNRGALRRKERVVKGEMERFGASMAQLARTAAAATTTTTTQERAAKDVTGRKTEEGAGDKTPVAGPAANRWAALRGYISATMEQNPAFTAQQ